MNGRTVGRLTGAVLAAMLAAAGGCGDPPAAGSESTRVQPDRSRQAMAKKPNEPWWVAEGVLDGSHSHEPMSFIIRRGGGREDIEEFYEREFSEPRAAEIAATGNNFVETCYFKGLGLEFERPEMERTKHFIRFGHKHGLRMGVYTQWGSIFNETFFHEEPRARQWVQIGVDGRPIEYLDRANQYFRWRGCPGNPEFLAYLRKAVDIALKEYGADIVYFDNMCLFEFHDTLCYCECCREGFRRYLAEKFPDAEAMFRRLGIRSAGHVQPPVSHPWTDHTAAAFPIRDPMLQEFIEFRCRQLADAWHEMYEYIVSVNPKAGIMGNPSFPRKYNERLTGAIDFWLLRRTPGLYYMENAVRNVGVRDGAVVSNIRGYRYGRALGVTFVPCGGQSEPALSFCEGLAFNNGSGHCSGGEAEYLAFFRGHRDEFYRGVEPAAQVAVLRDDNALTLRWHEAFTVMELAQQELMCAGVPWMPLWRQQLYDGTLERYSVLILPGNACFSRKDTETVTKFVERGGGLVILENAGTYDEFHHTIQDWRFARLFRDQGDEFRVTYADRGCTPQFARDRKPLSAEYGRGRVLYLPQVRKSRDPVRSYDEIGGYDGFQHLQLPRSWQALAKAVDQVAPSPPAVRVTGPQTLMAECLRKSATGQLLVHLVNYDSKKVPAGAQVALADGAGKAGMLYLPGDGSPQGRPIKPTRGAAGSGLFRLPAFARYALLVVE